ncbi:BPSS1780 family membrane protein [Isoalcanivorax pacificus]|nr:BPSS1780 family membrane protein [Isoalcanivorax pacificus]
MTNPYQQPSADLMPEGTAGDRLLQINAPRSRDIGAGWRWFSDAWRVFKSAWGTILLALLVAWLLSMAAQFVPLLGMFLGFLIAPFLSAGLLVLLYKADEQRGPTVGDIFTPFSTHFVPLLLVGLIYLGLFIGVLIIGGVIGYLMFGDALAGMADSVAGMEQGVMPPDMAWMNIALLGLIVMALMIPVMAAFWFAPALVVMGDYGPGQALKASLVGCLRNILPMLWYSVIMVVLLVLAMIPVGLGLIVLLPVLVVTYYSSFRDIYTDTL